MTKDYFIDELLKLVDGKIVGVVYDGTGYERYYGLKIVSDRREETKVLWFLRDEEGNGPGSFSVEDANETVPFKEA